MPCRSYESDWFDPSRSRSHEAMVLKQECDKLARIACKAITLLEQLDPGLKSFKDTESRKWWVAHQKADKARIEKEAKEQAKLDEQEKLRQAALAKLTPEEIAAFGLQKKGRK
jgi:hypothetical protein